ncbi:Hypothetical predicted protein [Mytilus galloprovincialis]|uniref:Cilia- and flagella-associated protein 206 n=1 Tax=Mytilus galloprovincialis TaxID=29158 RepID=A0A8B6G753_MYTGA|nr:Hypothetical predicted protein [Mytilus galloprovincialis]
MRSRNQEDARLDLVRDLKDRQVLVTCDLAMKMLSRKYREGQTDWFISQDSPITSSLIKDTVADLHTLIPDIQEIHIYSDNAGCYKNTLMMASLRRDVGNKHKSYNFSEAQDGKGACDRRASHFKSVIKRYINEGHDVTSAEEMKVAIDARQNGQFRVKVVDTVTVIDGEKNNTKSIAGITQLHNFQFESDGLRVWKAYKIGKGQLIPWKSLGSPPKPAELLIKLNWTNEETVSRSLSTEEKHRRVLESRLQPVIREITDIRARTREELESLYRKIVSVVLLRSGLGSPTYIAVVREANADLQSVFPQTELGTFMSLTKRDKERQLLELTMIVTGIRLFNKECGKGGEEINDYLIEKMHSGESSEGPSTQLLKESLINTRQHEAFLRVILPQFIHLSQLWSGFQDEMVLLSVLRNILASLEPFTRSKGEKINPSDFKDLDWLFPDTTKHFNKLPLQYRGYCAWALAKFDRLLLPSNPDIDVLRNKDHYYGFSNKQAATEFSQNPDGCRKEFTRKELDEDIYTYEECSSKVKDSSIHCMDTLIESQNTIETQTDGITHETCQMEYDGSNIFSDSETIEQQSTQQIFLSNSTAKVSSEENIKPLAMLSTIAEFYQKSESWQHRRQLLSMLSLFMTHQEVLQLIPDLTEFKYYTSKKHGEKFGYGLPVPQAETHRQKMDPMKLDSFLEFITSPHIIRDLPYGEKKLKLSDGTVQNVPNLIRCMGSSDIIQQYKLYCEENTIIPLEVISKFKTRLIPNTFDFIPNGLGHAIDKSMKNVRYRIKVVDNMTAKPKSVDRVIPSISSYSNFTFERNGIRVWKAYNIGQEKCTLVFDQKSSCSSDISKVKYLEKVAESSVNKQLMIMPSATKLSTSDSELDMGWALKEERKNKRFNKNQTDYLYEKFNKGQKSGRKEDPYSVSEAMLLEKNEDGSRRFHYSEILSVQQITS